MTDNTQQIEDLKAQRKIAAQELQDLVIRGASIGETVGVSERIRLIDMQLDHLGAPRSMFGGFLP